MRSSLHRVRRIIHNPSSLQYYARPILKYRRMASTGASVRYFFFGANESSIQRLLLQFGLQDPTLIRTQGFIGGKWVDAKHGDKIVVTSELVPFPFTLEFFRVNLADPATTEELGTVPEMGLSETKEAIDTAANAFQTWSRTSAKVRTSACLRIILIYALCQAPS